MKPALILVLFAILSISQSIGQTGPPWTTLKEESQEAIYFRILQQNGMSILNLKVVQGDLTRIDAHQSLYLKLGNDFVKLLAQQTAKACKGCGTYKVVSYRNAIGIDVRYPFSKAVGELMSKNDLEKLRIVTADGNVDIDVPAQNQSALRKALKAS